MIDKNIPTLPPWHRVWRILQQQELNKNIWTSDRWQEYSHMMQNIAILIDNTTTE